MFRPANELQTLAARVGKGDPSATATLRHEFERQLVYIVRRTMRTRTGTSRLARRILAEADRVPPDGGDDPHADRERVVRQVVRRISDSVIDRLQPGAADSWVACETVCA
jgi:hypothetical protein